MTNSELSEFLNAILVFLRDFGSSANIMLIMLRIPKKFSFSDNRYEMAINKLLNDGYILPNGNGNLITKSYCISANGIFFINAGGYLIAPEIKEASLKQIDKIKIDNPYPQIFVDYNSYKLFNKLHNEFKNNTKHLADYSFIYRMMYKDGFVFPNFRPEMFKEWLAKEPYYIDLEHKLKTLDNCFTPNKVSIYNTFKENVPLGI